MATDGLVRVGDTIRRPLHHNSLFVHELLRHFEAVGFDGSPRLLGVDEQGAWIFTSMLDWIEANGPALKRSP